MSANATSSSIRTSVFLRRVLLADAAVSAACGALVAFGATLLEPLLGLGAALLVPAGLALFPYAAYLVWVATRRSAPRATVWIPIVLNVVWAVDCLLVLFGGRYTPTLLGELFIGVNIVTVLVFAELEYIGLRRTYAIVAA